MSIELGSIGTSIGSVATGIGKAGAGVGPALASFGEVMKAPIGNIVNEGPVGGGFLEGFRPMNIADITTIDPGGTVAPLGEILFQAKPESTVASVENFLAQPRMPQIVPMSMPEIAPLVAPKTLPLEFVMPQTEPMVAPWVLPIAEPITEPVVEAQPKLQHATQTESRVSAAPVQNPAVLPQPLLQEQEEKEEVITQNIEEEKEEPEEEEDVVSIKKKIHLVDQPVLTTVLSETNEAIEKAKDEAERLGLGRRIIGSLVAKFLPSQHEGNTGGAVKPLGIDGTIIARKETIAGKHEFSSEKEVVEVVFGNRPVTIGESGDLSTQKEVDTTYQGRVVKPPKVIQIVEIRRKKMVEKREQVPVKLETKLPSRETKLEELDPVLAEVFQKAA